MQKVANSSAECEGTGVLYSGRVRDVMAHLQRGTVAGTDHCFTSGSCHTNGVPVTLRRYPFYAVLAI